MEIDFICLMTAKDNEMVERMKGDELKQPIDFSMSEWTLQASIIQVSGTLQFRIMKQLGPLPIIKM